VAGLWEEIVPVGRGEGAAAVLDEAGDGDPP